MAVSVRSFALGGLAGATLAYFLDPNQGRRRRKIARDRAVATVRHAERRAARGVHRAAARAHGVSCRFAHFLRPEPKPPPDDVTLTHRVESVVFRNPAVPEGRFNVNAEDGVVYLRGELDTPERIAIVEKATSKVPGIREIRNLLHPPGTSAPHV